MSVRICGSVKSRDWRQAGGWYGCVNIRTRSLSPFLLFYPISVNCFLIRCDSFMLSLPSSVKAFNSETDNFKLLYGRQQYHASCANFWINCVEPKPPGLILPDLL